MSNHVFNLAPNIKTPRSTFNRPYRIKDTIDVDYLYPIYCDEVLPGDTVKYKFSLFGRLATPIVPIMDRLHLDTFFFFVPMRLIDNDWKKFQGERPFGDLDMPVVRPMLNSGSEGVVVDSLSDHIGIPVGVPNLDFLPDWHRAYNLIWNEWFRPEYICPAVPVAGVHEDGTVTEEKLSDYVLLKRGKRLDYFTGANPFPQVGEAVSLPVGGTAPVVSDGSSIIITPITGGQAGNQYQIQSQNGTLAFSNNGVFQSGVSTGSQVAFGNNSGLVADLSNASAVTINELRNAIAAQHYLEQLARSGSRYIEILRGVWNVVSPDARLQRPEYLGGSSTLLDITTVPQTSQTEQEGTPQGNLAAFGTASCEGFWSRSFTEHGVILGLCNLRADVSYQQGINRMFTRKTRFDYYNPPFANIGEQAVLNKEIFAQGSNVVDTFGDPVDDGVFGYQEAWAEYRYYPDQIHGKFRSGIEGGSLDYWHLGLHFDELPTLSPDFVLESVPIDRCLAVTDEPSFIIAGAANATWSREMPLYSVPGLSRL